MRRSTVSFSLSHSLQRVLATTAIVLTSFIPSTLQAADAEYCMQYARDLISIPQAAEETPQTCQKDQPYWNTDKSSHIKACLSMSTADAEKKRYSHNKLVNLCNDTYKIIMLDRQHVATLPLSNNEARELQPAPDTIKQALFSSNLQNPFAKLYAPVQQALQTKALSQCTFLSLPVNLDLNTETREWVVTVDAACLTKATGITATSPHVWIIQQQPPPEGDSKQPIYRVLFEGQHHTLTLHYSEYNHYRNITISTALSKQEETNKRCGSIIADWHYVDGRYLPFNGKADEQGDCLPEYTLPDYLQGANTFELAEGEWQKGMEEEEEKRMALFAPYKEALQAYIPEWIKRMEEKIPANPDTRLSTQNQGGTDTHTGETQQLNHSADSGKSFMENVRSFLGLE